MIRAATLGLMVALRSSRLERLLSTPIAEATHTQVASLIGSSTPEDYDLEFKKELYGRSDKARRDLCGDVAAMANTAGGLIIIGIEEDEHGCAAAATEVDLSDDEKCRILQTVAAGVSPLPHIDVLALPVATPERGYYLIAVPRSAQGPHAVLVNDALRFPRRNGATIMYLTQPEVRAAYFSAMAAEQDRAGQLEVTERELSEELRTDGQIYLMLTLVPDLGGSFVLDTATAKAFQQQTAASSPLIANPGRLSWMRAGVGPGRLVAYGTHQTGRKAGRLACHLHRTGAGSFAAALARTDSSDRSSAAEIGDDHLADALLGGLSFLARHARDRAAAAGSALLRTTIFPVSPEAPAQLMHGRSHGLWEALSEQQLTNAMPAVTVADIDDLAAGGPQLVAAAHRLGSGLVQGFATPEILQFSSDGQLRRPYWSREVRPVLEKWAEAVSVEWTDDILIE
jgi:Putative DNA-binding domain